MLGRCTIFYATRNGFSRGCISRGMRTNLSFTQPSNELSSALAETISSVEVQCPMCANRGPMRAFGARHSDLACVCPGCRPGLMDAPLLPEGHTLLRELGRG